MNPILGEEVFHMYADLVRAQDNVQLLLGLVEMTRAFVAECKLDDSDPEETIAGIFEGLHTPEAEKLLDRIKAHTPPASSIEDFDRLLGETVECMLYEQDEKTLAARLHALRVHRSSESPTAVARAMVAQTL